MQIFHRSANSLARISIAAGLFALTGILWAAYRIDQGTFITDVGVAKDQPVPFSHKHHVGDDGIDCRYCHTSVETSAFAGLPPTKTCMTCHSQIWNNAAMLAPIAQSLTAPIYNGKPSHNLLNLLMDEADRSVLPFAAMLVMFAWTTALYYKNYTPPPNTFDIYVTGKQWMWKIQYPNGRRDINELRFPTGRA
jgi:hypothetical protein